MDEFAKLFGSGCNQILTKLDSDRENRPEVRIYFKPPGLGVSSVAFGGWEDDDAGWNTAEAAFREIDETKANEIVAAAMKAIA